MYDEISQFTEREKEVTELLLQGKSNKQIASTLGISVSTVEYHLKNIYKKLQVSSRTEAVLRLGKSLGSGMPKVSGESIVEIHRESAENGGESISTWRLPVNKMLYLIGGGLLTTALLVILLLANMPAQNTNVVPPAQANRRPTQTAVPTLAHTNLPTSSPTMADTSPLPFAYTVVSGDTCASIAAAFNVSVEVLTGRNHLSAACPLADGQILMIPNPDAAFPNEANNSLPAELYNHWVNVDLKNANITRVEIQSTDGQTYINMFGACVPTDCNWREFSPAPKVDYYYDSETGILNVKWTFDFQTLIQEVILTRDGQLKITTQNHYLDNSGRADFRTVEHFVRQ